MTYFKIFFTLNFLIFLTSGSFAQSSSNGGGIKFGFKGGVNFSNLYTDDVDDNNVLTGFQAGVFAKVPVTADFAIQPELTYNTKGAELVYNNAFVNGTAKFKLNYIELPVLAVFNLSNNFNIHAGPYIAYLVDGKATNDSQGTLFDVENSLSNEDYNKFDAGLAIGVGFDTDNLGVGVRYNYGLQTVGKERTFNGTNYTFPDGKNSVINVYLTLSIL